MKHLKSSLDNLKGIFESNITAKVIAEPFVSFEVIHSSDEVLRYMKEKDYDVVGVMENGVIVGYVERTEIRSNNLKNHRQQFVESKNTFPETVPLMKVFKIFGEQPRVFVTFLGRVSGIITRGDLQKIPVRIYLFGLISLIEMQLLRIIKERYPADSWKSLIAAERLDKAEEMRSERKQRNEDIGLTECLQFTDKGNIVSKNNELFNLVWPKSKRSYNRFLKKLRELRDELAHAQYITTHGEWSDFVNLIEETQEFLSNCETI